ncbi:beta-ketoacyl synthase N-terminal-like domain-containing protein [Rhizobium paknamense]|uniref:PfaB family protein n=1 Tax=Rhizobium paknamense TaxID=1206817 RepID=A0ABU0IG61_9HYPH|nr:beta-ketoacyl synthase N-terminal-like domain-containing protein [Rhizobium paknamense]MDQ0456410.1 PfaB family protein [Rhizobium paknamense]
MSRIAITALSLCFPGANDLDSYWRNLLQGKDSRSTGGVNEFRIDPAFIDGPGTDVDQLRWTRGGFIDLNDLARTTPADMPQGLDLPWQLAWRVSNEALVASDLAAKADLSRVGLVLGNYTFPTFASNDAVVPVWEKEIARGVEEGLDLGEGALSSGPLAVPLPEQGILSANGIYAVTRSLGLGGPAFSLDAACSSSLYAIELASSYLRSGKVDAMLAGGVCLPDPWLIHVSFGDLGAFPNNGVSQPFDNSSDGIVTGQGASVVVLRRLEDALKSNDKILAVIEGVGLSNDGTGQHMLVPNAAGQRLAYERAYARTDVKPAEVDYVECHATGTPLGDRTELTSLQRFFAADQAHFPLIGSVKANVGHLLTVAGMSSLAKVILAMQEGTIPATPGVGALQQSLDAPGMEKHLVLENRAWPTPSGKRHAAISAFGFGGTNAHMVVSDSFDPHQAGPSGRLTLPSLDILGMAAHFGTATSLSAFESACFNAQPMVTQPSQRRWRGAADHLNPEPQGAINAYEIDFLGNRIPPAETDAFNSQQGLVLKVANEALIDAGYGKLGGKHPPRPVAVLVVLELDLSAHLRRARVLVPAWIDSYLQSQGITLSPTERLELETACKKALLGPLRSTEITSYIGNICASRIASQWNFTGPVFTLSAGDLGVAYALEQAGLMIADDKAEAALVVAVDLASGLESFALEQAGQAAPAGPMGDGAGALVIAPHRPASETEKPAAAYAVLDRLSIHHATADKPLPVDAALSACAADAKPGLFEVAGMPGGLMAETDAAGRHVPGAVLAGIGQMTGNCKVAQPMAALIRAALSLARRTLPATPQAWLASDGSKASVEAVEKAGLTLMAESAPWIREERATPLSAVIGNSGPFGSYAAFRLSEAEDAAAFETVRCEVEQGFAFLPLAGESRADLLADLAKLVTSLEAGTPWQQLQRETLLASQEAISALKAVLTGRDASQLLAEARQLERFLKDGKPGEWQTPMGSYFTDQPLGRKGKIAFVYPGGFNSYPLLGRTLLHRYPNALRQFERYVPDPAATLCQTQLYPPHKAGLDANMRLMQVEAGMQQDIAAMMKTGVGFALIYTALLRDDFAIKPQGAIGYSMGEVSMLFANGVWPIEDHGLSNDLPLFKTWIGGPRQVVRDAFDVAEKTPNSKLWASSVLLAPVQEVRDAVAARSDVFITHVNTPKEVVIAGLPDGVNAVVKGLSAYSSYRSPVSFILHVPILRRVADLIGDLHDHPSTPIAPDFELFTTATYGTMGDFDRGALSRTITDVMCTEVDFVRMLDKAYDDGYRIFVECGPSATCSRWVSSTFAGREHLSINLNQRGADDEKSLIAALAKLVSHGVKADLTSLLPKEVQPASRTIISLEPGGAPLRAAAKAVVVTLKPQARAELSQPEALTEASAPMPATLIWGPTPEWLTKSAAPMVASAPISQPAAEAPKQERAVPEQTFTPAPAPAAAAQAETTAQPRLPARAEPAYTRAASRAASAAPRSTHLVQAILERHKLGHQTFLQTQAALIDLWRDQIGEGSQLIEHEAGAAVLEVERPVPPQPVVIEAPVLREEPVVVQVPKVAPTPAPTVITVPASQKRAKPEGVFLDEQDLLTFASGKVADALGEQFAPIDAYPVRVRLPAPPYFFVSRVTKVQAEFGKYQPCSLTTEYDVPHDAWYLVDGQMPPGVAVESGQSDLLLVALLGIDFKNKGVRKYRLLDGRLSFYGRLPKAGSTLRFDISIDRFVWQGDGLLFFFRYDGYIDGELALQLHSGCAGFFTEDELNAGGGVVLKEPPKPPLELVKPLLPRVRNTLEKADLVALSHGRIAEVFGPGSQYPESGNSIRLPPEMLLMIDRVTDIGSWRGEHYVMEAEKEFDAEGWYYTSHFVDDPVLPGSLIAEGATQLLKVYLIANGMHQCFADGMFEPTTHREMQITVRGQITPAVKKVRYRLFLQESGLLPRPYVIADVLIYDENDKPLVRVSNLGLQVVEKPGASIEPRFGDPSWFSGRKTKDGEKVVLNELSMAHAAKGELRIGLGPEFNIYGEQHRAPHIPNGCFQFVDRCLETTGKRGEMKPGAVMDTEYDAHADSWYFQENSHPHMPNFVVLESALQAAILNGYALGPTLKFPDKVYSIRNLDGTAVYLSDPDTRGTTIRHSQTLLNTALLSESILQNFDFNLKVDGQPFYKGQSSFGYFTAKALENQLGLDQGKLSRFWLEDNAGAKVETLDLQSPDEAHLFTGTDAKPHWRLPPGHRFRLLHKAELVRDGGKFGLGYIKGYRGIHAGEWYFTNHFHRDPVMPGSLGLEAILQAMQLFALKTGLDAGIPNPRFGIAVGVPVNWRYRGQLLRTDKDMNIEIHIKEIRKEADQVVVIADTDLFKEKLRIYEALSMSISIKPA